jgi:hypothetical protein
VLKSKGQDAAKGVPPVRSKLREVEVEFPAASVKEAVTVKDPTATELTSSAALQAPEVQVPDAVSPPTETETDRVFSEHVPETAKFEARDPSTELPAAGEVIASVGGVRSST